MRFLLLIIAACSVSCSTERYPVEIHFAASLNDQTATCANVDQGLRLTDLRFYVSNVRVRSADGEWSSLTLIPDDTWQNESVVLIDLEDGQGDCLNGSLAINSVIHGQVEDDSINGIAFEIGVPESLNHQNSVMADPPLGYTEMHWHWTSGYKFMRAGVRGDHDGFFLHLGSNRCEGSIGNIQGCHGANRATMVLENFVPGGDKVIVDLSSLFHGVNFDDGRPGECMSGPANLDCEMVFLNLGIDFVSGEAKHHTPVFRSGPR